MGEQNSAAEKENLEFGVDVLRSIFTNVFLLLGVYI